MYFFGLTRRKRRTSKRKSKRRTSKSKRRTSKKSKRRARKSKRRSRKLGRPRDLNKHKPERGCTRQTTKKYRTRGSPPYPANLCRDRIMKGNDGNRYKSTRSKREGGAYYKWKKIN